MAKGQGAFVSIGANTEELQAGMDEASRIVKEGKNEIEGSFQNWSGNTNAVADATNQLTKSGSESTRKYAPSGYLKINARLLYV